MILLEIMGKCIMNLLNANLDEETGAVKYSKEVPDEVSKYIRIQSIVNLYMFIYRKISNHFVNY